MSIGKMFMNKYLMYLNHLIVSYGQVVVILYLTLPTTLIKISKFQLMEENIFQTCTWMRCSSLRYLGSVFSTLSSDNRFPSISFLAHHILLCGFNIFALLQDVPVLDLHVSIHVSVFALQTLFQFEKNLYSKVMNLTMVFSFPTSLLQLYSASILT